MTAIMLAVPIVALVHACMPSYWLTPFRHLEQGEDALYGNVRDAVNAAFRVAGFGVVGALVVGAIGRRASASSGRAGSDPGRLDAALTIGGFFLLAVGVRLVIEHTVFMRHGFWAYNDGTYHHGAWYPAQFTVPFDVLPEVLGLKSSGPGWPYPPKEELVLLRVIRWAIVGLLLVAPSVGVAQRFGRLRSSLFASRVRRSIGGIVALLIGLTVWWISGSARTLSEIDPATVQRALSDQASLLVASASLALGLFGCLLLTERSWCPYRTTKWLLGMAASGSYLRYLLSVFVHRALYFEHVRAEALSRLVVELALIALGVFALVVVAVCRGRSMTQGAVRPFS